MTARVECACAPARKVGPCEQCGTPVCLDCLGELHGSCDHPISTALCVAYDCEAMERQMDQTVHAAFHLFKDAQFETRAHLLADAAQKPVRRFVQVDVLPSKTDTELPSDDDGVTISWGGRRELRNLDCLRVLIPAGQDRASAARDLRKIADLIERPNMAALDAPADPTAPVLRFDDPARFDAALSELQAAIVLITEQKREAMSWPAASPIPDEPF